MTTTTAPAQAAEQDVHREVPPVGALLQRRPELGPLAQAGVRIHHARLESA